MIKQMLSGGLVVIGLSLFVMGCVDDADNPSGALPQGLSQAIPDKGPTTSPPTGGNQATPTSEDVNVIKKGTVFENQDPQEITRHRNPSTGVLDKTKVAHVAGRHLRIGNANGNSNITVLQYNAGVVDANGEHNGDPSRGGRAISQGKSFLMTATVLSLDKDNWTLASSGKTIPEVFKTYTMQHVGGELFQAEIETPAYGIYIVNFSRVDYSEVKAIVDAGGQAPADWFPYGLQENSGYDMGANPRGIVCYARELSGQPAFGVNHDGSQALPADAVQAWPTPSVPSSGGSSGGAGGGSTNQPPVISLASIANPVSGTTAAIISGGSHRLTVNATDADGDTLSVVVRQASGATGFGPVGITPDTASTGAVTSQQFVLSNLEVVQRTDVTFEVTVSDGTASVNTTVAAALLFPNKFADIAGVTTTLLTNAPHDGLVGDTPGRTRSDGFGCYAFDPVPRNADGTVWTRVSAQIPYLKVWTYHGNRLGNTSNLNPPSPVGYPNGSNLDGGNNGVAGTLDGTNRYVYLIPLGKTTGSNFGVYFALNGTVGQLATPGLNYFQTGEYDDFYVKDFGLSITLGVDDKWKFNRAYTGVDGRLRPPAGIYKDGRYPFEAP